ncbi:MAG TPA: RDD family protein [Gaiellales bacterium]|nr:RDD family protein [Gaiellales bacterium]
MTTPERVAVEHDIAGVGSRAVAQLLDWVVISVVLIGSLILTAVASLTVPAWLLITLAIIMFGAMPFAYFFFAEWRFGATLGKRVMRIRVLTELGAPIGARESLVRNLVRVIDFLPTSYLLGGIVALISSRSQRLGDMAAGTVAVRIPKRPGGVPKAAAVSFVDLVAADEATAGGVPPRLAEIIAEFESRRGTLTKEAQETLASKIAARVERHLARPPGMSDDQFLSYARGRYG